MLKSDRPSSLSSESSEEFCGDCSPAMMASSSSSMPASEHYYFEGQI